MYLRQRERNSTVRASLYANARLTACCAGCRKAEKTNASLLKLVEETEAKIDIHPLLNKVRRISLSLSLSLSPLINTNWSHPLCIRSRYNCSTNGCLRDWQLCGAPQSPRVL